MSHDGARQAGAIAPRIPSAADGTRIAVRLVVLTAALLLFLGLTITLAAIVVLYVAGVVRSFAAPRDVVARPWLAAIPVLTPVIAWRAGARVLPIALVAAAIAYAVLQLLASAR